MTGVWDQYGLSQIWEMVRDEDGVASYQQISAWFTMAEVCTDQADQLRRATDQLMAKWPPRPGSAAAAFKQLVDQLVLSMRDSAAAARANQEPLAAITSRLGEARVAIEALIQAHRDYEDLERPRDWNEAVISGPKPMLIVPSGWRDTLDRQARTIMSNVDIAVGSAAAQIQIPGEYHFEPSKEVSTGSGPIDGTKGPAIPGPRYDPPSPQAADLLRDFQTDVVLDGGRMASPNDRFAEESERWSSAGPFVSTPAGMALAPGGVIDRATTAIEGGETTRSTNGAGSSNRIPTTTPMVPPMTAGRPAVGPNRSGIASGGRRRRRSDPDDPWAPPAGGPAVLEPQPEPTDFDPGPNVIGLNR